MQKYRHNCLERKRAKSIKPICWFGNFRHFFITSFQHNAVCVVCFQISPPCEFEISQKISLLSSVRGSRVVQNLGRRQIPAVKLLTFQFSLKCIPPPLLFLSLPPSLSLLLFFVLSRDFDLLSPLKRGRVIFIYCGMGRYLYGVFSK